MTQQQPLPNMPGPVPTFLDWCEAWFQAYHPEITSSVTARGLREEAYPDLPDCLKPSYEDLLLGWFADRFQWAVKRMGRRFFDREIPDAQPSPTGDVPTERVVVKALQLELPGFTSLCVQLVAKAAADVESVRTTLVEPYAAAHPRRIRNVARFMKQIRRAAGL